MKLKHYNYCQFTSSPLLNVLNSCFGQNHSERDIFGKWQAVDTVALAHIFFICNKTREDAITFETGCVLKLCVSKGA